MFESLMTPRKSPASFTQPALAFAIHAAAIVAVLGGQPSEPFQIADPDPVGGVIYVHAPLGTNPKLHTDVGAIVARLMDGPEIIGPVPGPLPPLDGGWLAPVPGGPRDYLGVTGPGLLTPGLADSIIYEESELTDSPVVLQFPEPVYPTALENAGIGGTVDLTYVVDAQGHVEQGSVVILSSDHPAMAESVPAVIWLLSNCHLGASAR